MSGKKMEPRGRNPEQGITAAKLRGPRRRIGIVSLGCPRNMVDSEGLLGRLKLKGYSVVDVAKADVAVVNTCAFIEDARRESVDAIFELVDLKKRGVLKKIIVCGCLSQRYKDSLRKELPEVDAFVGRVSLTQEPARFALTPKHYAYLKICEGCVNICSYCVIPFIKGKFSSLDMPVIISKARQFNKDGLRELNIIGQDITGYGIDIYKKYSLTRLLSEIIRCTPRIHWIRLLYLYPQRINDELLEFIRDNPRVCKYIDVPIQHINERILKLMHRSPGRCGIIRIIEKIRKKIPHVALRTSLIVGFPTETEKEFKELLKFVEESRFERLGAFIYSREEGTAAFNLKPQVPLKVQKERFNQIMTVQQKISTQINESFLGKTFEVLIEEPGDDCYLGRTQFDAPEVDGTVYVHSKTKLSAGDFVKARITDTLEYDLIGEVG